MPRTTKSGLTVASIKDSELYAVALEVAAEGAALSDTVIEQKLFAAEDFYEKDLRMFWTPRRVFSDVYGRQAGVFAGTNSGLADLPGDLDLTRDIAEPAYDYDRDLWGEDRWGNMNLNFRPVKSIGKFFFAYPGVEPIYSVPPQWIRLDQKFGRVQLVPSSGTAIYATFNSYVLGVIAGGRGLPQSIYVDYVAGFEDGEIAERHQDLLEGLRLRTLLGILGIAGTIISGGQSGGSLSLDGLSHSRQFSGGEYGPFGGRIKLAMDQESEIRENFKKEFEGLSNLTFIG